MSHLFIAATAATGLLVAATNASTQSSGAVVAAQARVGGAEMLPSRNIVQNASNSPVHTTLVTAITTAGLADTLSGPGPITVFAPTDDAFARLPAGTVDTLLQPANRAQLQAVLTYHVVPGRITAAQLMQQIRAGNGSATLTTVQGGTLTARMQGNNVVIVDARGGTATVTQADVMQSNGVIHVTNAVSLPAD